MIFIYHNIKIQLDSNIMNRIRIGLSVAAFYIFCFYMDYYYILFASIFLFLAYDCAFMLHHNINKKFIIAVGLFMSCFNYYLLIIYLYNTKFLLAVLTVCQVADVFQYIYGTTYGVNKIGWISENKTFEGYIGGYFWTLVCFSLTLPYFQIFSKEPIFSDIILYEIYCVDIGLFIFLVRNLNILLIFSAACYVSLIYVLSITGGLISSSIKRYLKIKDYSNLFGDHGGWLDRIDSIILPFLVVPFLL